MLLRFECIHCANITQVQRLYSDLFDNYYRKLFPLIDHSDIVNVSAQVGIVSINNFNELSGEIELTLLFYLTWTDERLKWTPSIYGGKSTLIVPPEDIWRPHFYVIESFEKIQEIGNISLLVRISSEGLITWNPSNVLKLVCSVDVTYFPFDTQTCQITILGWAYTRDEMLFYTSNGNVNQDFINSNSQWELYSATVSNSSSENTNARPSIDIVIALKRRSDFFVVYIIIPIIMLGSINNLVFLMPPSSGERTSVAITTFLSFVVYMEMINANVPESSAPMAYIYYYILLLMLYSSLIICLCIVSLRINDRDGEVPHKVKQLRLYLRCKCLTRKRKTSDLPSRTLSAKHSIEQPHESTSNMDTTNDNAVANSIHELTWKEVGNTYDLYCCSALMLIFWIITIVTFTHLYNNRG